MFFLVLEEGKKLNEKNALLKRYYDSKIVLYKSARDIVLTQLNNWRRELKSSQTLRNPIDSVTNRIKTFESLVAKCKEKGIKTTDTETIMGKILDIVGIRVICTYKDDIYRIEELIRKASGISIQRRKDYVANPKDCGYSSLHLNTLVQVSSVEDGTQMIPVEIQIRTSSMQAWAQVEHRSQYKSKNGPNPESIENLRKLSDIFKEADELAMKIRIADGEP